MIWLPQHSYNTLYLHGNIYYWTKNKNNIIFESFFSEGQTPTETGLLIGRVSSIGGEEGALVLHQPGAGLVHHVEVAGLACQLAPVRLDIRSDALHQFLNSKPHS